MNPSPSRRDFLRTSSAALPAVLAGTSALTSSALAAQSESGGPSNPHGDGPLRIALVGCGGRGTGAARQALSTAGDVRLVAAADAFEDRLTSSLTELAKHVDAAKLDVPAERRFVGFDAFRRAIDLEQVDVVILATPPGFRPQHFEYAIERDKHVFMEKPVAVDGSGIRRVLAAGDLARAKDLKVGVGLQRHHDAGYQETVKRIQDGAIGEVKFLRCYWNSAGVWVRPRQPGMTEMEYQMRNWYYFNWLCGDHIVEQHIHNLDVCNWIMGGYPVKAEGQGGRQVRKGIDHGEIFDHHMVEFTYANGTKMLSQCRHVPGAWSSVSEHVHGTRGTANVGRCKIESSGGWSWRFREDRPDPYQVEHDDLFAAIRAGHAYNEAERGAKSTMTAILGRLATYSGQIVQWDAALASELALLPDAYDWAANPPSLPGPDGRYPVAIPGETRVI